MIKWLFSIDHWVMRPLGLIFLFTVEGEPGQTPMKIKAIRIAKRPSLDRAVWDVKNRR